jgi:cellulose synthase/poly-beta-1,6-N-acetylglucosamine synthase-like glycosyltransferase
MNEFVFFGKILFYICITPLILYSLKFYALAITGIFFRGRKADAAELEELPSVSVHIPVYNDPVVVECVKSCLAFDYPKDKLEVIVVDDSTDETTGLLKKLHKETKGAFRHIRRGSRKGFKAGALNEATKVSKGDIIVIFDSDYILDNDFLKKAVKPFFEDDNIAFVQTRWDYLNPSKNLVSRIAMTCYSAFHQCSMPVKEKIGTAIFCGTGGAIRKDVLVSAGGWNEENIGEDIDLTVRILSNGYKQAYLPYVRARGEVPETFKSFIKQQQRWAYGTTKVMKDYLGKIMSSANLSKRQKIDLVFIVTGFLVFPFILGVTISTIITMAPWFGPNTVGEIFNIANMSKATSLIMSDMLSFEGIAVLLLTCGYIFECSVALIMQRRYADLLILPWIFILGAVIQFTNTIAVFKALLGREYKFYKTPKALYRTPV